MSLADRLNRTPTLAEVKKLLKTAQNIADSLPPDDPSLVEGRLIIDMLKQLQAQMEKSLN